MCGKERPAESEKGVTEGEGETEEEERHKRKEKQKKKKCRRKKACHEVGFLEVCIGNVRYFPIQSWHNKDNRSEGKDKKNRI